MRDLAARRVDTAAEQKPPQVRFKSEQLLRGARKIVILHDDGSEYTLQVTRQNKLLLTK